MNAKLATLRQRRQDLLVRSTVLREQLVAHSAALAPAGHAIDGVVHTVRWLRTHPAVPIGVAAVLLVRRPRQALRWGIRWGWRTWRGWQWVQRSAGWWPGLVSVWGRSRRI